jgi:hypothetical protein
VTVWKRTLWTLFALLVGAAVYYTITRGFADNMVGNCLNTLIIVCLLLAIARTDTNVARIDDRLDAHAGMISKLNANQRDHLAITTAINKRIDAQEFSEESTR